VVVGGGHHGGAWKVAYADFVTAMMAFFMLMWLLNATTEKQRKGIADYFSPTIPISRISGGGDGMFGGDSVFSASTLSRNGTGGTGKASASDRQDGSKSSLDPSTTVQKISGERDSFAKVQGILQGNSGESSVANPLLEHINTRVSDEGLIVEIFDLPDEPLFENGGTVPSQFLRQLIGMITKVFNITSNNLAINGHTRSYPTPLIVNPGWDLSTSQAHRVRKLLDASGFDEKRVERVTGFSDRKQVAVNPMSVRNNRIELILLRSVQVGAR